MDPLSTTARLARAAAVATVVGNGAQRPAERRGAKAADVWDFRLLRAAADQPTIGTGRRLPAAG